MKLSLRSVQWLRGVEPLYTKQDKEDGLEDEDDELMMLLSMVNEKAEKCTSCEHLIDFDDRRAVVEHYQSPWHRRNVQRVSKGLKSLTEEEFEDNAGASDENHHEDADDDNGESALPNSQCYFQQAGTVYSIYRAVLHENEFEVSPSVFSRPLDCAIFLFNGGHFAAGIFQGENMVEHKTIHRYTARAKQGGVQSRNDNAKGPAKSAGAALRRYNEAKMKEEVADCVKNWSSLLERCPLIFIRCASYYRATFHQLPNVLDKDDPRLRSLPFQSARPNLTSVKNCWEKLQVVRSHGGVEQFLDHQRELAASRRKKMDTTPKVKKSDRGRDYDPLDGSPSPQKAEQKEEKKKDHLKPRAPSPVVENKWPLLDDEWRKKFYNSMRGDDVAMLVNLAEEGEKKAGSEQLKDYVRNARFRPLNSTYLHVCAASSLVLCLKHLLNDYRCDPTAKDETGKTAYAVSANKLTKEVFVQFRQENPELYTWARTAIPEPVQLTEEQLEKLAIKKKEKKLKNKEKAKEKKEEERKLEEERKERDRWLNLSDRERRAEALERRLAGLPPIGRCDQCCTIIVKKPFEYASFKFCTVDCVQAHRAAHP